MKKNVRRDTKKERNIRAIWQHIGAYQDFIEFISGTAKSIGIQCKQDIILEEAAGGDVMLNDLIVEYNRVGQIHFIKEYAGCFRSRRFCDAGKYIRRFRKEVIEAINRRYNAGFDFAGMERDDVLRTVNAFFDMLL